MKKINFVLVLFFLLAGSVSHAQTDSTNVEDTTIYTAADVMPEFPEHGFQKYLQDSVRYPFAEKDAGKQGTVYIAFIVEKDGRITNIHPLKEVPGCPGFTKEAVRIIAHMPNWKQGTINGRPVRVQIVQPFRFTLLQNDPPVQEGKKKKRGR